MVPLQPDGEARTYETLFTFDGFGRMLRLVYPDGETLRYSSDGGGLGTSAFDVRPAQPHATAGVESYLRSAQCDEFGQRVQVVLGNGVVSRYAYHAKTRRLSALDTVTQFQTRAAAQQLRLRSGRQRTPPRQRASAGNAAPLRPGVLARPVRRARSSGGSAGHRRGAPAGEEQFTASFAYSGIHNMLRNEPRS
jgi:hypothetical protein